MHHISFYSLLCPIKTRKERVQINFIINEDMGENKSKFSPRLPCIFFHFLLAGSGKLKTANNQKNCLYIALLFIKVLFLNKTKKSNRLKLSVYIYFQFGPVKNL